MKLSQHVRGLHAVIGESAADDIASDIEELESKLGRYRTALERIIETWDGDSESMHDDPAVIAREALSDE